MAKKKHGEEREDEKEAGAEEAGEERKPAKKRKTSAVKRAAKPKKVVPIAKPGTNGRPLSVGGIIIRTQREAAAWEKQAPWHRKSNAESRFERHGTDRRPKD